MCKNSALYMGPWLNELLLLMMEVEVMMFWRWELDASAMVDWQLDWSILQKHCQLKSTPADERMRDRSILQPVDSSQKHCQFNPLTHQLYPNCSALLSSDNEGEEEDFIVKIDNHLGEKLCSFTFAAIQQKILMKMVPWAKLISEDYTLKTF